MRDRITELRIKKGVSEFQMSRDLGHSRSYIQQIVAGRTLPSLQEFLYICDYFGVTPSAFFDEKENEPILVQEITKMLRNLKDDDLLMLIPLIKRLEAEALGK